LQLAAETLAIHGAAGQTAGITSRATRSTTAPLAITRADAPLACTTIGKPLHPRLWADPTGSAPVRP
jgi:uncharacterized Zn-finger protein